VEERRAIADAIAITRFVKPGVAILKFFVGRDFSHDINAKISAGL